MIEVKNLKKSYNDSFSLNIQELKISEKESFGLVGNNGAGKTTFFRLVLDLIQANEGEILSKGKPVAYSEHWKQYTGSFLDENFLIEFLNFNEYLEFVANLNGLNKKDVKDFISKYSEFIGNSLIEDKKYIRDLSKGNQSKVGIMAAIIGEPEIIILDEPFAHLDPSAQIRLKNILIDLRKNKNSTLLISSHDLKHVTEVCDRIVVLENGSVKMDLKTNPETLKELENYFTKGL